jgi:hypothetical protein
MLASREQFVKSATMVIEMFKQAGVELVVVNDEVEKYEMQQEKSFYVSKPEKV